MEYKMVKEDEKTKWYLKPVSVVLLLFLVLGPLGLPLLHRSPKFSKAAKIALTAVVMLYTFYLIFVALKVAQGLYLRLDQYQEIFR